VTHAWFGELFFQTGRFCATEEAPPRIDELRIPPAGIAACANRSAFNEGENP
jgi:hypothetical protein